MILPDDKRYRYTAQYLAGKGYIFHEPDRRGPLDFAIFPFKAPVDKAVYDDGYFAALGGAAVFSGIGSAYLSQQCAKHHLSYYTMMDDRGVQVKNAVPTSEGVVAYLIHSLPRTIANSRVLVVGYGVCGKDLALRLKLLGAHIYALVRNREKAWAAQAGGVTPGYLDDVAGARFDAVINTVPGRVFSDEMVANLGDTLLVDIASAPYSFDMALAKNKKSVLLPGIPGKYAVQTAGEILGEYIDCVLRGNDA
jgi:dipicolinate synthase subunit A